MLERNSSNQQEIGMVEGVDCEIQIPSTWTDFFERRGPMPVLFTDERRFPRYFFRKRAVLKHGKKLSKVYTKDISREGLSFLHSRQLYPCTEVLVWLSSEQCVHLTVARCLRVRDCCYECGGRAKSSEDQAELESVLQQLIAEVVRG